MGRRRSGFARTVKGLEIWLDPEVAGVIRRSVREVQELISSEPAVDGLAGLGVSGDSAGDPVEDAQDAYAALQDMLRGALQRRLAPGSMAE